jgi:dephospho-CoA kinase
VKVVGLTGGIATGKSTVATILRRLGAKIIDADDLSREIVQPGQTAWNEIIAEFGKDILRNDQTIDRQKLRKIVFANPKARKQLESIIHPRIQALARERIRTLEAADHPIVVYEAPLLFENSVHLWLRPVILVACDPAMQKQRLRERDRLTDPEIQQHLDAQMPIENKRRLADFVIENSGGLEELEKQVETLWTSILAT